MAVSEKTKRTLRTVVQCAVGLAAGLPVLVSASGVEENAAGVATVLAVAAAFTRIMAAEPVQPVLRWLGLAVSTPRSPFGTPRSK